MADASLLKTPLHELHAALGAKMVPFAGYAMPVQYPAGILAEHKHTRAQAGLFDVSHMGQLRLRGDNAARRLESLVPGDIQSLAPGRMRYTLFTLDGGGIIDDLMVTMQADGLFLIVNAARKDVDLAHLASGLSDLALEPMPDHALMALQGPAAAAALARLVPGVEKLAFMQAQVFSSRFGECHVSRSGYTGEDGFEISVPGSIAADFAQALLALPEVKPIGLGARDSLRLEAGLCLYGHDIDETTTPIEAALAWTISKRRRSEGGFPGAERVLRELREGASRRRVGLRPEGRAPAREGTEVQNAHGRAIGQVTSGGFAPSLDAPIAMGYVATEAAKEGTAVGLMVRGKSLPGQVATMPFVPHRYVR